MIRKSNNNLDTVYRYHAQTKHFRDRYARSLGYMDWANQPNPFREYQGAKKIFLASSLNQDTPPYSALDTDVKTAGLNIDNVASLFRFGMGIAAYKTNGVNTWAVRCNASSGNLHPTESYTILPNLNDDIESGIYHYDVKNHALELLSSIQHDFFDNLPKNSFIVALSSIAWREVWKYGERAFRYVNLDVGHAWQSLVISAKMLGWSVTRVENITKHDMQKLFGFHNQDRFVEAEYADMVLIVSQKEIDKTLKIGNADTIIDYKANQLSKHQISWELIQEIIKATGDDEIVKPASKRIKIKSCVKTMSGDIVLNRRSVREMHRDDSIISKEDFHQILNSVNGSLDGIKTSANLCIFVHRVKEYKSGLYILIRDQDSLKSLKQNMKNNFLWEKTECKNLYKLELGDFVKISKIISCSQDIASDGSFSLGMLCSFDDELHKYGAHRYKELYWECGCVGQQLYIEATSLGLSATGIGCFLDDEMHNILGLTDTKFQVLYHLTVGRGD